MAAENEKSCKVCGRRIEPRRKWREIFDEVQYCSAGCRRKGLRPVDQHLEATILELLDARAGGATICPSEAARQVEPEEWRGLMESARAAARRLVARGRVQILQRGRVVDPSTARGPIRIRLSH